MKILRLNVLFLACALFITACSTVPYTGRTQFLMISEGEEATMGRTAWAEILKKEKISSNKKYSSAVSRVGKDIAAVSDRPDFSWEFKTIESKQANAFCLPGGKVAVYTGIFKYISNDAELAAVMGHEVGHAIARHGGERVSHGIVQELGAAGLAIALDDEYRDVAMIAYGVGTNVGVMLPYSRTHEYESDVIGMMLMAKAGYNPRYAITFWKKFSEASDTNEFTEYFSTHPMGVNRVTELQKILPEAIRLYEKVKDRKGVGQTY